MEDSRVPWDFLSTYFKIVSPFALLIVFSEECLNNGSSLNRWAKEYFLEAGENAELFLAVAGGADTRSSEGRGKRGIDYYNNIVLPVYEGDEGKNMAFKDFMI